MIPRDLSVIWPQGGASVRPHLIALVVECGDEEGSQERNPPPSTTVAQYIFDDHDKTAFSVQHSQLHLILKMTGASLVGGRQ